MTTGILELHPSIDGSSESLRRTFDIARRALRAIEAFILAPSGPDPSSAFAHDATLEALVTPDVEPIARLVVRDEPGRVWSEDDEAILRDLAAGLAAEIRLTDRVSHLEARRSGSAAPALQTSEGAAAAANDIVVETGDDRDDEAGEPPGTLHILLADDLDLNRKLICDMLSLEGYVVDSVADGAAAVEAVKAKAYDLVLMDMIMPGMDGMDATRAIRALPAPTCDVPIVALTAHSFREQLDNCLHAGMNATLTKPMSFDALSSAVSTWVRSRPAA